MESESDDVFSSEDDEVFSGGDCGSDDEFVRRDRSRQGNAISFSFTGIPMSRQRSRSVSRPAPSTSSDNSVESSSKPPFDRRSPSGSQTTCPRRHSLGPTARPNLSSGEYQMMCRPPSRGSDMESRGRSATRVPPEQNRGRSSSRGVPETHRGRSATRASSQSESQGRAVIAGTQEKPRGRSVTRAVRRSPEQSAQGPTRSASCARAQDKRNSPAVSDRLGDVQLRQSVEDLRRSLHDLSSALGFQNPSSTTMETLHRRMEADYEKMKRQNTENDDANRDSDEEEEEEEEEELLQIGPKTAVVPPFNHSPPPPRSETPSRIPVPRSHSPRPPPAPSPKYQRSHSVCNDAGIYGKHDALSRRNSYDVKISTPLVTGRSSFISNGRAPSGNRCFRPSRSQKQSG